MPLTGVVEERVKVPPGVRVHIEGDEIAVEAGGDVLRRHLGHPRVSFRVEGEELKIRCDYPTRREKAIVGTFAAHVRNMVLGLTEGFTYRMKIVYSHFPMKASVRGEEFVIENFLGEKHPRKTRIVGKTKVEVQGDQVILRGPSVEDVGQTAANIEQTTKIRGFDPRVFQDGIYITSKGEEA